MVRVASVVVCALFSVSAWAAGKDVQARPPEWFVAPLTVRVLPSGVPKHAATEAKLRAARGDTESFFVIVQPKKGARISARLSTFKGEVADLPSTAASISRVLFVDAITERVADAVVSWPDEGLTVKSDENLPLLVEVNVPRKAVPGSYRAEVVLNSNHQEFARVPVRLTVLPQEIPATSSLPTAFKFQSRNVWMLHDVDRAQMPSVAQRYAISALRHRISLVGGSGLWPTPERREPGEGWMVLDFTAFDREVQPLMTGVETLDGAKATALGLRSPPELSPMERFKYVLAVRKHLRERGWLNRLVLVDGEPVFARDAPHAPERLCECTDVKSCRASHEADRPWWKLSSGGPGQPSIALGTEPMRIREIGWYAFDLDVAGISFDDAVAGFDDVALGGFPSPNALYYPPGYGGSGDRWPVESVRLKLLRDGLEDYELLRQADSLRQQRLKLRLGELLPKPDNRGESVRELLEEPDDSVTSQAPELNVPAPK